MRTLSVTLMLFAIAACGDKGGTNPTDTDPAVNFGGVYALSSLDGETLPAPISVGDCPSGLPRQGWIASGSIELTDQNQDPEISDPARARITGTRTSCTGGDLDSLTLVVWGTFMAWQDSVAFDWWDDGLIGSRADRDVGLTTEVMFWARTMVGAFQ